MSKPWQFEKVKAATRFSPALWAVLVGGERIGYVWKGSRDLFRAGRMPEVADTIHGSRRAAAQWLYEGEVEK